MLLEWPLVGRRDELELVGQALTRTSSAGVVLAGAPGVGKTRLAEELLRRSAAAGGATAWVRATRSASAIPFGAFAHLLPGDLRAVGPVNLLRLAGDVVTGGGGPLVLGVDDAHLLDPSSAALVRHLGGSDGCFVVVTVRSREPVPDAIVSLWKDGPLERIEVPSLTAGDVAELLPVVFGGRVDGATVHRLWEASRGNALYLRELVRGGVESGALAAVHGLWRWQGPSLASPRLAELVEARLGDLDAPARAALEIVAQAEPLEAAFLEALTDAADREALERRGLLETTVRDRRRTVRVSHPLYAEALRATTPPSRSLVIWRQLADQLVASGARRTGDLLRLATWRLEAGGAEASTLFSAAARQAVGLQDFRLAERLARAAIGSGADFAAQVVLANALIGLGRGTEAETLLADLERHAVDDGQRAQAALRRSDNLLGSLGDGVAARTVLARALGVVSTSPWRESLLAANARLELFGGNARRAVEMVAEILERPDLDHDLLVEVWPLGALGRIVSGRPHAALEFCDRLIPLAEHGSGGQHGALAPDLVAHNRCAAALVSGRISDADRWSLERLRLSTADGIDTARGVDAFSRGWTLRVMGRIRSAAEVLEEAVGVLREIDFYRHRSACLGELAHCHALLGDIDAAEQALVEANASTVASFVVDHSFVDGARAWLAHARGEHSRGREIARGCAERCTEFGQLVFAAFAWHDVARMGDPQAAARELRTIAPGIEGELIPSFAAHATTLAAGDGDGLDRVAAAFEQMGAILYAAEAAAAAAQHFRRDGRTGSALTAASRARVLVDRCEGARTPAIDALDASLPLTRREREVAVLAARGLTNRQIAAHLVVSVRTVDNHLHSAYAKLGVANRHELAGIVLPGS